MNKETQNKITGGLNGLLNLTPTPQATAPVPQPSGAKEPKVKPAKKVEPKQAKQYKIVCYNLDVELIEAVRAYAYNEHKKLNAVVTEALEKLIKGGAK